MTKVLRFLLTDSKYTGFHLFSIAFFAMGFFVALTASDLGPVATILVPMGLYLAIFSLFLESLFWLKTLGRRIFRSRIGT